MSRFTTLLSSHWKRLAVAAVLAVGVVFAISTFAAESAVATYEAESFTLPVGTSSYADTAASAGNAVVMPSVGTITKTVDTPAATRIEVRAKADACKGNPTMSLSIDGAQVLSTSVGGSWASYSVTRNLTAGTHTFSVAFSNDRDHRHCSRSLRVDKVTLYQSTAEPAPTTSPVPGTVSINDSAIGTGTNQFEFVGSWIAAPETRSFGGDEHYTNVPGAYYQVRFTGTQAKILTTVDPNHGIAAVSIDGGAETMIDTYAASRAYGVPVYTSPVLANAAHTIKVRVTGTKNPAAADSHIVADRMDVSSSVAPAPTATPTPPPTSSCSNFANFPSRLKASGRNIVDENNCVMPKLKGFNMHVGPGFTWPDSHFNDIAAIGGKINRAVIHWDQFEPSQGQINATALANLDAHVARAQAAGLYTLLEVHLNVGRTPSWAGNINGETERYAAYGQTLTQNLANRYGNPNSPKYTKAVIGFGLNEPPLTDGIRNGSGSVPWLEEKQRQMISWFRAPGHAADWIGFVTYGYAAATPLYPASDTYHTDADPQAYDRVGGNVVIDIHDYVIGCTNDDPSCDGRQYNGMIYPTYQGGPLLGTGEASSYTSTSVRKSQQAAFIAPYKTFTTNANIPLMMGEWGWPAGPSGETAWIVDKKLAWSAAGTAIEIHWNYDVTASNTVWAARPGNVWRSSVTEWMK